jgi:hypothetical protein
MDHQTLVAKLDQIEEQARLTLEFPKNLLKERQQMIIALARYLRAEAPRDQPGLQLLEGPRESAAAQ